MSSSPCSMSTAQEVARIYSNRPAEYPVSGRKTMGPTPWGEHVLNGRQPYLGEDKAGIRWAFFDHELIESMGLGSVINVPAIYDGKVVGTINLLAPEHHLSRGACRAGRAAGAAAGARLPGRPRRSARRLINPPDPPEGTCPWLPPSSPMPASSTARRRSGRARQVLVEGETDPRGRQVRDLRPRRRSIDLTGRTLMPGLIDAHVHVVAGVADLGRNARLPDSLVTVRSFGIMRAMLMRGFTTVRDVGGADFGLKLATEEGHFPTPRLVISGKALSQTGGHADFRGRYDDRADA